MIRVHTATRKSNVKIGLDRKTGLYDKREIKGAGLNSLISSSANLKSKEVHAIYGMVLITYNDTI